MLKIPIKPIITWPGRRNENPISSPFRATYRQTLDLLDTELYHAKAVDNSWFISMFVRPEDIRNDGELRSKAKSAAPGIIFNFTRFTGEGSKTQDISFPCDRFWDWKDNLRAIALSMENLRRVERYGVFKYADIISRLGLPEASSRSSKQNAAEFISQYSGFSIEDICEVSDMLNIAYKHAARKLHPDNQATGSKELFQRLTEAKAILES